MDDIVALADSIYRERVARARKRPLVQKLALGGELFDGVRERMVWGIRSQFPAFSEAQVHDEFIRRLKIARKLERRA